jgi:hypothetical protein
MVMSSTWYSARNVLIEREVAESSGGGDGRP